MTQRSREISRTHAWKLLRARVPRQVSCKMEFHVKKKAYCGGRCGTIRFSNREKREINTPACMLYMRGGAAPHLTNEIINDLFHNDFIGVHITLPTMFQYPGPEVLKSFQEGIGKFLALQVLRITCMMASFR